MLPPRRCLPSFTRAIWRRPPIWPRPTKSPWAGPGCIWPRETRPRRWRRWRHGAGRRRRRAGRVDGSWEWVWRRGARRGGAGGGGARGRGGAARRGGGRAEAEGGEDERLVVMVLQAVALQAHGEEDEAAQLLGDALALADGGGLARARGRGGGG